MYRIIHLDFFKSCTYEYTFNNIDEARKLFNEIVNEHPYSTVVLEDNESHEILDNN